MAQYLKEDIKEKILLQGELEFYTYGYRKASIRNIAKNAGVSTGNFYRYFESKDQLFKDVVSVAYYDISTILMGASSLPDDRERGIEEMLNFFLKAYHQHRKAFYILINGAKGSEYENVISDMMDVLEEEIKVVWSRHSKSEELARPIAAAFVYGFRELFYRDNVEQSMVDYVQIITRGMRSEV